MQRVIKANPLFANGFYILPSTRQKLLIVPKEEIDKSESATHELHCIATIVAKVIGKTAYGTHIYEVVNGKLKTVA